MLLPTPYGVSSCYEFLINFLNTYYLAIINFRWTSEEEEERKAKRKRTSEQNEWKKKKGEEIIK